MTACPTCGFYLDTAPHEYGCRDGRVHQERAALTAWLMANEILPGSAVRGSIQVTDKRIYFYDFHTGKRRWKPLRAQPPEGVFAND